MTDVQTAPAPDAIKPRRRINIGLDRFSGLYVLVVIIIIFSIWLPDFRTWDNASAILTFQAISIMLALGLLLPVAAGAFDLTFGGTMTVSLCFVAWALLDHRGVWFAVGGAFVIAIVIGLVNAFVVVKLRVDSFIGTLAMSSILLAVAYMISSGAQQPLPQAGYAPFMDFARTEIGPEGYTVQISVLYALILAAVLWWLMEYTPVGRRLYATGGNPVAARLAGVKIGRVTMFAFVVCALIAAFAGIVYLSTTATAAPKVGESYLLPAFSAVFLGATQIKPGRVNVLGTLVAILLLAVGVNGLQLAGAPTYVTDLFNGAALILAMALAARTARRRS